MKIGIKITRKAKRMERKILQRVCSPVEENYEYRDIINHKIDNLLNCKDIVKFHIINEYDG